MRRQKRYGWRPDKPDHRDLRYQISKIGVTEPLPQMVDLRAMDSPILDQGRLGSCTAHALAGAVAFADNWFSASRLFIYFCEREMEGDINEDSGAELRDGVKSLASLGVCDESIWPYDISIFTKRPSPACYESALKNKIKSYHRIVGRREALSCLAEGFPFVFGMSVFEGFESPQVAKTGIVEMPGANERSLGGHAVCAVGYDMEKRIFICRNSWGSGWGQAGYFTIPFDYLDELADDFWTIRF